MPDWSEVLAPETPLLEILVRGTLVYLALFLMLRVVLKRETAGMGVTDLLVVVLIADAAQNAMANDYRSVPDGLLLVAVIIFWAYALDWLGYRFPALQNVLHPSALPLVKDGQLLQRNLRRELVTRDELMSSLRLHGVDDLSAVRVAYMESDGRISVLVKQGHGLDPPPARRLGGV